MNLIRHVRVQRYGIQEMVLWVFTLKRWSSLIVLQGVRNWKTAVWATPSAKTWKLKVIVKASVLVVSATALLVDRCPTFRDDVVGSYLDSKCPWRGATLQTNCTAAKAYKLAQSSSLGVSAIAKSDYQLRHIRPSARMDQPGSHWKGIREIWYLIIFLKFVHEIQVQLKSIKNNGYCTWRPVYIFYHTSFVRKVLRL
jgi:hypothetical protein